MQDKLLLIHRFINEIMNTETEDELTRLSESYMDKLGADPEENIIYELWNDALMLGREYMFLKASEAVSSRSKQLAALTADERNELAEAIKIIDENRFEYHFQPIVNTTDGSIYSYEALMRPISDLGLTPLQIIKYAELTGRLNDIERATFFNALNIISGNKEKLGGKRIFINSIPNTKLSGDDFRYVGELLVKHSDTAVVELTEQEEPDEHELKALKERYMNMGIKIAIDDYGTGYSNVKNLLRYMPDYVKIDRSLLSDIQNSPKKRHFVREIIEFCHGNGIMALAEGVETSEELHAVILLGADLIQGFYTARPNAEFIDSIPYEIRQEIRLCQQQRQDGKGQQVYTADTYDRVLLERLEKDGYECILIGKDIDEGSEITVVGSPSLDTDIHIEIAAEFNGRIVLENVNLSNVKNRPCIDLGENSDAVILLRGENKLNNGGIRVPDGARFTLEGEGNLYIKIDAAEYFGIGNAPSSGHGEIIFRQSGTVTIDSKGQTGAGIGSGLGGTTSILQGKYILNMNGDTGVGIGALFADSRLELTSCDIDADISFARGTAIGSVNNNADIHISRSSAKLYMGGAELAAVGTLSGAEAKILINNAIINIDIWAPRCTCAGSLNASSYITVEEACFRADAGGGALPFGGYGGNTKVSLINADTGIKMKTDADIDKYISSEMIEIVSGRTVFTNHGNEIELKKT